MSIISKSQSSPSLYLQDATQEGRGKNSASPPPTRITPVACSNLPQRTLEERAQYPYLGLDLIGKELPKLNF